MTKENSERDKASQRDIFVTTRWTLVLAAGERTSPQARIALEELCRIYWYPLYAYVRRHGRTKEDAEDLTQAFFVQLLERNDFDGLSSERGKFRAYLLGALKHFLANEWDRARAQKRGGNVEHLSLDWPGAEIRYEHEPISEMQPDRVYDRAWAITLLERVLARLAAEHSSDDKAHLFEQLKGYLTMDKELIPYRQAAIQTGCSEGAVRVSVHRLRQRYRELLRDEIAQTLNDPTQVDDELRALRVALLG